MGNVNGRHAEVSSVLLLMINMAGRAFSARMYFCTCTLLQMRSNIHSAPQTNCTMSISIKNGLSTFCYLSLSLSPEGYTEIVANVSHEMPTSISLFTIQLTESFSISLFLAPFRRAIDMSTFNSSMALCSNETDMGKKMTEVIERPLVETRAIWTDRRLHWTI